MSDCEVTTYVNHDVKPCELSWECTCGAKAGPFSTRRENEASSDLHLDGGQDR
jgi:hypothetical protein